MKQILIILAIGMITFTSCKEKPKPVVNTNVVNNLDAYQVPDSLAKYAVGSEHNPVLIKGK